MSFNQETISVKEYQEVKLNEKEILKLEKMKRNFPNNFYERTFSGAKFKNYVGVINLGKKSIEILPKIEGSRGEDAELRSSLVHMLFATKQIKLYKSNNSGLAVQNTYLLDIFIRQYILKLKNEFSQGLLKTYEVREEDLKVVKGKINLAEQIRNKSWDHSVFSCIYDEFTSNNIYNQIVKLTLLKLQGMTTNKKIKHEIKNLLDVLSEVETITLSLVNFSNLQKNKVFQRYEDILDFSEMFLKNIFSDVTKGEQSSGAILFDMNKLFEEYVSLKLIKVSKSLGLIALSQKPQRKLLTELGTKKNIFTLKPDITISQKNGDLLGIIDIKWKELGEERPNMVYRRVIYTK